MNTQISKPTSCGWAHAVDRNRNGARSFITQVIRYLLGTWVLALVATSAPAQSPAPAGCAIKSDCLEVVANGVTYFDFIDEAAKETTKEATASWPPPGGPDYETSLAFVAQNIFLTDSQGTTRSDEISLTVTPDPNKKGFNFIDIVMHSDPGNFGKVGPNDINEDGKTAGYAIIVGGPFAGYIDVTKAFVIPAGSAIDNIYVYSDYSPEPSSLLLLGSGVLTLAGVIRKRPLT